jgi:DNA-binding transcriptional LysR family regulator
VRIACASTFGRLHVLPLIPELLSRHPGLRVDLVLADFARDMVEDRIDLALRVGTVNDPDSVVKRIACTPLVCVGSRRYFERHGIPKEPADLAHHNCLVYGGLMESADWPFHGPQGRFSVAVSGTLSSNSVETIRSAVLAGVGIGLFAKLSLTDELSHPDIVTVLDDFIQDARDVSIVWPRRRFVPARVRRVTDFFAGEIPKRLERCDVRQLQCS